MKPSCVAGGTLLALVLLGILFFATSPASSETILQVGELLRNGGFESSSGGIPTEWSKYGGVLTQVSAPRHRGSYSGAFSSYDATIKWIYQTVPVSPGATYLFEGYVYNASPAAASAFFRVSWYANVEGAGAEIDHVDSQSGGKAEWTLLSVSGRAPAGAASARCKAVLQPSSEANATVYLDDVSFIRLTPTPTATPTNTATATSVPTPTHTPTISPTATPTPSATATVAPTSTPTVAPTSSPTATPLSATPTPAATTPTSTATATATASATPSPSPTSAPPPGGQPPPPVPTPTPLGELLPNGGFESSSGGIPAGWSKYGGVLTQVSVPRHSGSYSGAFSSYDATAKWIYQTIPVSPGATYLFKGYVYNPNPSTVNTHLRISWYANADGTGPEIGHVDSQSGDKAEWTLLTVSGKAPDRAASARCKALLQPSSEAEATVYFDDLSFVKTAEAPPPQPAPPPPPTPTTTPISTPTTAPVPTPVATPLPDFITNDSFERATAGVPNGWETYGGNLIQVYHPVRSGSCAAAFVSNTASTKWMYQIVSVLSGESYVFSGYAYKDDPNIASVYLRLSWYASADGSGRQLSYNDALTALTGDEPRYRLLTTGVVSAPLNARSAKTRIMLDPLSSRSATAYFDDVTFIRAQATPTPSATATVAPTSTPTVAPTPSPTAAATATASPAPPVSPTPAVVATPRPTATATPIHPLPIATTPPSGDSASLVLDTAQEASGDGETARASDTESPGSTGRPSALPQAGGSFICYLLLIGAACLTFGQLLFRCLR